MEQRDWMPAQFNWAQIHFMKHAADPKYVASSKGAKRELAFGELAGDLFGADKSPLPAGETNVSGNVKRLLKKMLLEKHSRSPVQPKRKTSS